MCGGVCLISAAAPAAAATTPVPTAVPAVAITAVAVAVARAASAKFTPTHAREPGRCCGSRHCTAAPIPDPGAARIVATAGEGSPRTPGKVDVQGHRNDQEKCPEHRQGNHGFGAVARGRTAQQQPHRPHGQYWSPVAGQLAQRIGHQPVLPRVDPTLVGRGLKPGFRRRPNVGGRCFPEKVAVSLQCPAIQVGVLVAFPTAAAGGRMVQPPVQDVFS